MNQKKILKQISQLKAQLELQKASMNVIENTLTVLEKEVVGSSVPATSSKRAKKLESVRLQVMEARQKKAAKRGS